MRRAAIFLIQIYQKLPQFLPTSCIYIPTCSEYAKQAFEKHFFLKALGLTVFRILRCNPFSRGGFDPVR
ncbi:MAG: membrane protein insertion efficiency factor YidD [Candidatus Omnitrophica bacterium]|nr:membrane protein insertion efficiency factor YidD [Candidatus Omnitrophota bacterium]MCF7893708.1 membrane protein insertion efficiency factor YidD [Candidatus Omnitrophota bacterium]